MGNGTVKFAGEHRWSIYQTGKSLKRVNRLSSDFPSFFLSSVSVTVSQASTITAVAITTIQTWKNDINHWVLHSLLIVIVELELFLSDSQALRCYKCLVQICHFARIRLFIASTPPGSSTEYVFRSSLPWKMGSSQSQVYSIMQNIERGCACFQEKVCIARAAVNESVCVIMWGLPY